MGKSKLRAIASSAPRLVLTSSRDINQSRSVHHLFPVVAGTSNRIASNDNDARETATTPISLMPS